MRNITLGAHNRSYVELHIRLDAASAEHGDLLDLIRLNRGFPTLTDAFDEARAFLNEPASAQAHKRAARELPTGRVREPGEAVGRLFALTSPVRGTIAETYLRRRGITGSLDFPALGFLPNCYYREGDSDEPRPLPALIARVTDA